MAMTPEEKKRVLEMLGAVDHPDEMPLITKGMLRDTPGITADDIAEAAHKMARPPLYMFALLTKANQMAGREDMNLIDTAKFFNAHGWPTIDELGEIVSLAVSATGSRAEKSD